MVVKTEYFVNMTYPKFKEFIGYVDEQGKQEIKEQLQNYEITVDISESWEVQEYEFYVTQIQNLIVKALSNKIDNETALKKGKELEVKRDAAKIKIKEHKEKLTNLKQKNINRKIKFLEG